MQAGQLLAPLAVLRATLLAVVAACALLDQQAQDLLLVLHHLPLQACFRVLVLGHEEVLSGDRVDVDLVAVNQVKRVLD